MSFDARLGKLQALAGRLTSGVNVEPFSQPRLVAEDLVPQEKGAGNAGPFELPQGNS